MLNAKVILSELRLPPPRIYICYTGVKVIINPVWNEIPDVFKQSFSKYWFFEYILVPPSFQKDCGSVDNYKTALQTYGYKFVEVSQDFFIRVNATYNKLKSSLSKLYSIASLSSTYPGIQSVDDLLDSTKIFQHIRYYWSKDRILIKWTDVSTNIDLSNISFANIILKDLSATDYVYRQLIQMACVNYNIQLDEKKIFDITIGIKLSNLPYSLPVLINGKMNEFVKLTTPDFYILINKDGLFEVKYV